MTEPYPEHEKMAKVKDESQLLGYLIDWMQGRGYLFAKWVEGANYRVRDRETGEIVDRANEHLTPVHKTVNQWLAEIYDIDLQKVEDEKERMLDEIRAANRG